MQHVCGVDIKVLRVRLQREQAAPERKEAATGAPRRGRRRGGNGRERRQRRRRGWSVGHAVAQTGRLRKRCASICAQNLPVEATRQPCRHLNPLRGQCCRCPTGSPVAGVALHKPRVRRVSYARLAAPTRIVRTLKCERRRRHAGVQERIRQLRRVLRHVRVGHAAGAAAVCSGTQLPRPVGDGGAELLSHMRTSGCCVSADQRSQAVKKDARWCGNAKNHI